MTSPTGLLDPRRMSRRARTYTAIGAAQNSAAAVICLFAPSALGAPAYETIREAVGLTAWGVMFALIAFSLTVAGITGSKDMARWSLVGSAAAAAAWAAGLFVGVLTGPTGPMLVVMLMALAGKDLVMVANPFITPFEQ